MKSRGTETPWSGLESLAPLICLKHVKRFMAKSFNLKDSDGERAPEYKDRNEKIKTGM